uniref:BHLH domain-containing protein n=1 Tax=Mesocestoides corti TaxID=53468 RepID=A0A5K3EZG6_MESCO
DHQTCRRPWHNVRARVNGFLCLLACQKHLIYKMESVSNNEYAATSSQTQIGSTNYIRGRELLTHFANLTNQDRRKTIVQNRSSPESSSSPNSASMYSQSGSNPIGSSGGSNNNNSEDLRACSEIYSAILSSQQSGSGIDDRHRLRPVSFSSPTRHLSEPATAAVRRSPNEDPSDRTPRSCRTSPSIPTKSSLHHHQQQQQQHYHHHSQLDPMSSSSPNSSLNGLDHHQSTSSALSPPALVPSPAVFSLTQSELQELMRKTSATIPAVISAEEIKKANNSSQLYLLVPSNYPVIMTCSTVGSGGVHQSDASGDRASVTATTTTTTAAILGESLAAVTDGNQRALLERFQLSSATASPRPPSPQASSEQVTVSSLRAPRKNSTNIPPMLLQSLKDVVPSLALRGLDILDGSGSTAATGSAGGGGGGNTLPHLSSLALAYGFSPGETNPSSTTAPSVVNLDDHLTSRSPGKKGSLHPPPPLEPASLIISPSHGVSPDLASRGPLLLEDYRGAEMKIKPPPPADTGICSDGLLSADSNGSPVFFPSNESPPTRNYMGRMGGGGGGVGGSQGNQSGGNGDSKDIRRRVSHNEVERRRRDRINTWIAELYKLLPPEQQAKSQYQSKGVVLKRVCEYFQNYDANMKTVSLLHDHDLSSLLVQPTDFNEPDQLRLALLKSSFFTSILPSAVLMGCF